MKTNTKKAARPEKHKYVFEYGGNGGANTDLYLTLDENELTSILQSGRYKMTVLIQENNWMFVELCENSEHEGAFGYFMSVSGLKESYDFMFRFVECSNVELRSEYESEILKEVWKIQNSFKEKRWSELEKFGRVKLSDDFEKENIPVTYRSKFNDDITI